MKVTNVIRTGLVGVFALALGVVPAAVASADVVDTAAPVVAIVSPANDSTVRKNTVVSVVADASDDVGVTQVDFYARNVADPDTCSPSGCPNYLVCTGTASTCDWQVPNQRNAMYELTAVAHDAAGNVTISSSVYVRAR